MKKTLAILLSVVLFVCTTSVSTSASGIAENKTNQKIYKMCGTEASILMKTKIEETGVKITDDSIIELRPVHSFNDSDTGYALVITNQNQNCNTATKDVLLLVSDDSVGFEEGGSVSTRADYTVEFPPLSWDGRFVVRATAVYNVYLKHGDMFSPVFQPLGARFTYQKYESCDVSNITVLYICDGIEYTYPGFENLGTEVEHVITVSKSNPVESSVYYANKQYDPNRVIDVTSGSPFVGQFFTFQTTVDGEFAGHTVAFDGS